MSQVEAVIWVGLALLLPVLAHIAWQPAVTRLQLSDSSQDLVGRVAPWIWGIGPAYLALITGAIPARFFGLSGHSPLAWFGGAVICGALIGIAGLIRWPQASWPAPARGILDEPRWALYRAAGILWIAKPQLGILIGLVIALLEWVLRYQPWKGPLGEILRGRRAEDFYGEWQAGTWETIARIAVSAILFALTRNFWLTALSGAVLLGMLRRDNLGKP